MEKGKKKQEVLLEELIAKAKQRNIEVRTERLLREVGYHARSGRCRLKEQELIILDRDAPVRDQVEFLAEALSEQQSICEETLLPSKRAVQEKR
ncbi:MAG: hypothetical protein E6J89_05700 [Deltaproteobacteria bacterium]|nr:MAG: hypothetical protein E6J89_05700 [Deltaproteobacteria bacterium]